MNFLKGIMNTKPPVAVGDEKIKIKPQGVVKLELKGTYESAHGKAGSGGERKDASLLQVPEDDLRKMLARVTKAFGEVIGHWDAKEKEQADKILAKTKKRIKEEGLALEETDESFVRTAVLEAFWDDFEKVSDPDLREMLLEANEKISLHLIADDDAKKKKALLPKSAKAAPSPVSAPGSATVMASAVAAPEPKIGAAGELKAAKDPKNEAAFRQLRGRIRKIFLQEYEKDPLEGRSGEDVLEEVLNAFAETDDGRKSLEFFRKELASNPRNVGKLDSVLYQSLKGFVFKEFYKKVGASKAASGAERKDPTEEGEAQEQEDVASLTDNEAPSEEDSGRNPENEEKGKDLDENEEKEMESATALDKFADSLMGAYFVSEFSGYERKLKELVGEYPEEERADLLAEVPLLVKEKIEETIAKHYAAKYPKEVAERGKDLAELIYAKIAK